MKNAELWKRIVRDGLISMDSSQDGIAEIRSRIVSATILVDSRPAPDSPIPRMVDSQKMSGVCLPFETMWVETHFNAEADAGFLVGRQDADSGGSEVNGVAFLYQPGFSGVDCISGFSVPVNEAGEVFLKDGQFKIMVGKRRVAKFGERSQSVLAKALLFNLLETLELLSCKNVSASPRDVPERSRFACKRHGGEPHPSYRYHVLVVKPPGARSDSHPGEEIGTMPRHVCRGHFREYSEDRPLFGRAGLFGRFFIPPHMKGDKKNGVVEKDYEVRASA